MNGAKISANPTRAFPILFAIILAGNGCNPTSPTGGAGTSGATAGTVELQVLPLDGVLAKIEAQRGSIVVVDNWATWCPPCVQEFPELVEIHRKYAKDGVVCMSASLDKVKDQGKALSFLKEKGASFPNFLMENAQSWGQKWNINSIPAVLVFGKDGQLIRKFDRDDPSKSFTYADVDKLIQELLRKGQGQPETKLP
jgi:thiol-disulfide isomerase/thioredoxin